MYTDIVVARSPDTGEIVAIESLGPVECHRDIWAARLRAIGLFRRAGFVVSWETRYHSPKE